MLGAHLEAEIRQQPALWRRLAGSDLPARLAAEIEGDVWFIASGSSFFVSELAALALARQGVRAQALAASEAAFLAPAVRGGTVVALSQSGRSGDLLGALDAIAPRRLVALTNDGGSPLAVRAHVALDIAAGREEAVPATKSVSGMAIVAMLAASALGGALEAGSAGLRAAADAVEEWLRADIAPAQEAARRIAAGRNVVILGRGFGVPIAQELALKFKEASYLHAEGFAEGEFRHGSTAMIDASYAVLTLSESSCIAMDASVAGADRCGPPLPAPFTFLGWLIAGQMLALGAGRARQVESDAPRGLTKFLR
jgi:glucosamine--fructose-6-phosphate aminotransferase (isomerizing)